jgi:hypothetical protein
LQADDDPRVVKLGQKINANKRIDALKAEAEAIRAELAAFVGGNVGQRAFAYTA